MQIMNLSELFKNSWRILTSCKTLENLPDAVLLVNSGGKIEYFNRRAKEIFCFVDNSYGRYHIKDILKDAQKTIEQSAKLQKPVLTNAVLAEKEFYAEINAQKKSGGYCVVIRDMSALTKELDNEDKIIKFNNEKNAMLAKLDDEIKSPVSSIAGFSQGLLDGLGGSLSEKQNKYIKIINTNANELYTFLDKLLMFSRVESSIYEQDIRTFDVVELIKKTSKDFTEAIEAKGIAFAIDCEGLQNRNICVDLAAIKEAFRNITEVVLSMTEKGYISVRISTPDENLCNAYNITDCDKYLYLEIRDTGAGFAEDEMKYLCEPYAQLEKGRKNFLRSLRLGIASILIKRANGFINIRSEVMKGTKYEIILPVEKRKDE